VIKKNKISYKQLSSVWTERLGFAPDFDQESTHLVVGLAKESKLVRISMFLVWFMIMYLVLRSVPYLSAPDLK
jgi:hypothetical protein